MSQDDWPEEAGPGCPPELWDYLEARQGVRGHTGAGLPPVGLLMKAESEFAEYLRVRGGRLYHNGYVWVQSRKRGFGAVSCFPA